MRKIKLADEYGFIGVWTNKSTQRSLKELRETRISYGTIGEIRQIIRNHKDNHGAKAITVKKTKNWSKVEIFVNGILNVTFTAGSKPRKNAKPSYTEYKR